MSKIKVVSFAKGNFTNSQRKLNEVLKSYNINFISCGECDLSMQFLEEHKNLFKHRRGFGYWIWKPYIILEELKKLKDDEILVYLDSTDLPSRYFFDLVTKHLESSDIFLVNRGYRHSEWTKRDCFVLMGCDSQFYHDSVQLEAGVIGLKKGATPIIEKWYNLCKDERLLTDIPNSCGLSNLPGFKDHRHDQSILTNIAISMKLPSMYLPPEVILYNYHQPQIYG